MQAAEEYAYTLSFEFLMITDYSNIRNMIERYDEEMVPLRNNDSYILIEIHLVDVSLSLEEQWDNIIKTCHRIIELYESKYNTTK